MLLQYIPAVHDSVVVQVTNRGPESYQCTLFTSSTPSSLPSLAFEGATKRSKPNIRVGSLLYATVVSAGRHVESELSCFASESGKSEGFGELKVENGEGIATIFPVSCGLARRCVHLNVLLESAACHSSSTEVLFSYSSLLDRKHPLLSQVAAHFPFETAIGMNGLIWVRAASPKQVVAIGQILRHSDERARELAFGKEMMTARSGSGIEQDALITSQGRGLLQPDEIALIIDRNR